MNHDKDPYELTSFFMGCQAMVLNVAILWDASPAKNSHHKDYILV